MKILYYKKKFLEKLVGFRNDYIIMLLKFYIFFVIIVYDLFNLYCYINL